VNRRQKKTRLKSFNESKASIKIKLRARLRRNQEAFALDWHRDWIQRAWIARGVRNKARMNNTPKTSTGEW
jgi:hypothetical protein